MTILTTDDMNDILSAEADERTTPIDTELDSYQEKQRFQEESGKIFQALCDASVNWPTDEAGFKVALAAHE